MLQIEYSEEKKSINLIFKDYFSNEFQFQTAFDMTTAKEIAEDILKKVKEYAT